MRLLLVQCSRSVGTPLWPKYLNMMKNSSTHNCKNLKQYIEVHNCGKDPKNNRTLALKDKFIHLMWAKWTGIDVFQLQSHHKRELMLLFCFFPNISTIFPSSASSRSKFLLILWNIYCIDTKYGRDHLRSPEEDCVYKLWWSPDFSFSGTMRLTIVFLSEMSQQPLDWLPPSGWSVITLVIWLFINLISQKYMKWPQPLNTYVVVACTVMS